MIPSQAEIEVLLKASITTYSTVMTWFVESVAGVVENGSSHRKQSHLSKRITRR